MQIMEKDIEIVEVNNERVITFKMIDELHGRIDGTARVNYNKNKAKFKAGKHFYHLKLKDGEVRCDGLREFSTIAIKGLDNIHTNGNIVLTLKGYLMLVKSLQDDKAWEVQECLIDSYFINQQHNMIKPNQSLLETNRQLIEQTNKEIEKVSDRLEALKEAKEQLVTYNKLIQRGKKDV